MGRVEKTLLTLLAVCTVTVGWLSWQSGQTLRSRSRVYAAQVPSRESSRDKGESVRERGSTSVAAAHVRGELVRSALPAPVRDIPMLRREIASRSHGTYIDFMLVNNDSLIVRWPERYNNPIKVWIQPSSTVAGWSANMASTARDAFGMWSSISVPLRFDFVSDSATAEMVVTWRDRFAGPEVGSTKRFRDQHGWLGRAEITLALQTADGSTIDGRYLNAIVIHEVGHALGLEHSSSASDIMAARNDGVFQLTPADAATLALIYAVPPGSIRQ